MAASATQVRLMEEIPIPSSKTKIGKNLCYEIWDITYDGDKTVEVETELGEVIDMDFCEKNGAVGATAYHLGTDFILDATTGKLTVSTIANNALTFRIKLWGYA